MMPLKYARYVFFVLVVSPEAHVVPLQLAVSEGTCHLRGAADRHPAPCVPRDSAGPGDPCALGERGVYQEHERFCSQTCKRCFFEVLASSLGNFMNLYYTLILIIKEKNPW